MSESNGTARGIVGPVASFVTGVILALLGVIGGLSALTGAANPASASETIVVYEAR